VAIKEYLPAALALRSTDMQVMPRSPGDAERFELGRQAFIGEAQTLARCDHPALLRIMRVLQRHGTVYRVMRYCPGPTLLAHRRDTAEAPDMALLRLWLDHLLAALQTLHDEGCVHGAVAPGNILLGPGNRPVLLDFDAVRTVLISDRTQNMTAALEPCFAPIEQRQPAAHLPLGPWTDLYSLAATLHFCVSGQLPTPVARDAPAGFEPLSAVWQRRGLADAQDAAPLFDALDACLAGLPEYRPQSVAQFRELLLPHAALPHSAPAASRLVPESIATQGPPLRPHAPEAALRPASPLPEAQTPLDEFDAAHDVSSITASALQPRRDGLFIGSVLMALAILGIALWWESTGIDPLSKRNGEPAAAAMALPAAEAVARSDLGVPTLPPPPAAARPEPAPPQEPPALPKQATQTTATPAAQPAAPPPETEPPKTQAQAPAPAPASTSPREVCGKRTQFALYRCMQTQCARPNWSSHEQCRRLRLSDAVD